MGRLDGKVAIITGAASGMGLAAAKLFGEEGAKVVAADVVPVLDAEIAAIGNPNVIAMKLDVSSEENWKSLVDATVAGYGTVDILVNNAGIFAPRSLLDEDLAGWNKIISVDLTGVWLGMKTVIPVMQKNGKGSIVNTSSIAGILGGAPDGGGVAYSAAKGGVRSITKHAAQWYAKDNIRVNSVHPGAVFTGMARAAGITSREQLGTDFGQETPLPPHAGEPLDIAYGYLYLASDESKYVTGEELVIDGGWITH